MMIEQIRSAARRSKTKAYLPYGMVFTLTFIDAGIDLDGEDFKSFTHTDYYMVHSLHHMGYQKMNDQWVKKVEGIPGQASGSSSSPSDSIDPSSPASALGPSSPAPALTPALVTGEHAPISPHTPFMHHSFNFERVVEQAVEKIMKRMEDLLLVFSNRSLRVLMSIEYHLRDSLSNLVSRSTTCLKG